MLSPLHSRDSEILPTGLPRRFGRPPSSPPPMVPPPPRGVVWLWVASLPLFPPSLWRTGIRDT